MTPTQSLTRLISLDSQRKEYADQNAWRIEWEIALEQARAVLP